MHLLFTSYHLLHCLNFHTWHYKKKVAFFKKLFLEFPFVSILALTFSISQTYYDSHQSNIQILDSNLLNLFLSLSSLRQVQLHHFSLQRFLWCLIIYKILAQVPYNSSQLLGSKLVLHFSHLNPNNLSVFTP